MEGADIGSRADMGAVGQGTTGIPQTAEGSGRKGCAPVVPEVLFHFHFTLS